MVHLQRYLCEAGQLDEIYRDYHGLICPIEDDDLLSYLDNNKYVIPQKWESFSSFNAIVLLGPPRQGKTTEFKHQCSLLEHGFFLPLRDISDPNDIDICITDHEEWNQWLLSDSTGELFIDALDEGKIESKNIINFLANWIKRLDSTIRNRLKIHLSCRDAEWARADHDRWFSLFGKTVPDTEGDQNKKDKNAHDCIVIELLDLSKREIDEYCTVNDVAPDIFLSNLPSRLIGLVSRPQTLKFLVEDFKESPNEFPSDTSELYERIIQKRLQDPNSAYERADITTIGASTKRTISEFYALISILTNRDVISIGTDDSEQEIQIELSGYDISTEKEVFKTDLFRPYNQTRFRFIDPGLTAYIAANKLHQLIENDTLSLQKTLRLFFPSTDSSHPVPILNELLIWLCSLNPKFRKEIIQINPGLLIHDYLGDLSVEDRISIWDWLVQNFGKRGWFEYGEWYQNIGILACQQLLPSLIKIIKNRDDYGLNIRSLAIEIARQGQLKGFISTLATVVTDFSEDIYIRSEAGYALVALDPDQTGLLKEWLDIPKEHDRDNILLCQALDALWPTFINLDELIKHLRPHREYYTVGKYRMFLRELPNRFNAEQRRDVIDALNNEILERINSKKQSPKRESPDSKPLYASDFLADLLYTQLEDWKDQYQFVTELEKWLSTLDKGREHGLLTEREAYNNIRQTINESHYLRQLLCEQHIIRIYREKGSEFDPNKFIWSVLKSLRPNKEDFIFWQKTLEKWEKDFPDLVPVAFDSILTSWADSKYTNADYEWIENVAARNSPVMELWDRNRKCSLDSHHAKWERKSALKRKKENHIRENNIKNVKKNIQHIRSGSGGWIPWFTNYAYENTDTKYEPRKNQAKQIESEFGTEVSQAYLEGFNALWQSINLPELSEYYFSNSTPWEIICVLQAIDAWSNNSQKWSDIPGALRKKALQAGLSELNKLPKWYLELVTEEIDTAAESLWLCVLDLEAQYEVDSPHLANALSHRKDFFLCQKVAKEYLLGNPDSHIKVVKPLLRAVLLPNLDDQFLEFLFQQLANSAEWNVIDQNLHFLAAIWRYKTDTIWSCIESNYLEPSKDRVKSFEKWIMEIESIHDEMDSHHWPAWSAPDALLKMLPDFMKLKLPESRFGVASEPVTMRYLRDDLLRKLAESGDLRIADKIIDLLEKDEIKPYSNILLSTVDRIKENHPKNVWIPLNPKDLWDYIEKDKRPIRNHEELFLLVQEMTEDLKLQIEGGEGNLKRLFWRDPKSKGDPLEPNVEENFQIIVLNEIKKHPLAKKIIGVREIEISGGNEPDITIFYKTQTGENLKLYIEMKRQLHPKLFTAIRTQLADKYLIDPDSKYGIYLVSWYGPKYYGMSNKTVASECKEIPKNSFELQRCLQELCDQFSNERQDIEHILAVVIDTSLN